MNHGEATFCVFAMLRLVRITQDETIERLGQKNAQLARTQSLLGETARKHFSKLEEKDLVVAASRRPLAFALTDRARAAFELDLLA